MYEWSAIYRETYEAEEEDIIDKEHLHPNMHQIVFVTEGEMELSTKERTTMPKGSISFISNIEMHCVVKAFHTNDT